MSLIAPLIGIIGFDLSHGINPSHGWPVAVLYAMRISNSARSNAYLPISNVLSHKQKVLIFQKCLATPFLLSMLMILGVGYLCELCYY